MALLQVGAGVEAERNEKTNKQKNKSKTKTKQKQQKTFCNPLLILATCCKYLNRVANI